MKTENEYAEMLIEQYYIPICGEDIAARFAINDVQNTIDAIMPMCSTKELEYYNNVLNILKEKV